MINAALARSYAYRLVFTVKEIDMKKIKVLFSLLAFIMLVGVISCGPVPQEEGESNNEAQNASSFNQSDTDSIQLKQGTTYAYDKLVVCKFVDNGRTYYVCKFVDDGCTYYVGYASTNYHDGGVSVDIEHSASCTNPIHNKKERDREINNLE